MPKFIQLPPLALLASNEGDNNSGNGSLDGSDPPLSLQTSVDNLSESSVNSSNADAPEQTIPNSEPSNQDNPFHLSLNTVAETELLSILCEMDAPLYAYQSVMNWASKHRALGYQFNPSQSTYHSQISKLKKTLCMSSQFPTTTSVTLPLNDNKEDSMMVTTFEFVPLLHSLLADPNLTKASSLSVNPDNPFAKYSPPNGLLGEVHSGLWYHNAWNHMTTNTNKNFLIGIILYIDKTCLSFTQKLSVHPVNFSLSIFNEQTRSHPFAWRTLGYLPIEDVYLSSAEKKKISANLRNQRLHLVLDHILQSFREAQHMDELNEISLQLCGVSKTVSLYLPLAYVIGDVEGGDQLCGHESGYNAQSTRLCRTCDIPTSRATDTTHRCRRIEQHEVEHAVMSQDQARLKQLRQRPTKLAFFSIDSGGDKYGIFGKTNTEALHSLEQGVFSYLLKIFFKKVGNVAARQLDESVKLLSCHCKQGSAANLPRLSWPSGMSTLSNLTGDQVCGKVLTLTLLLNSDTGHELFPFENHNNPWKKNSTRLKVVYILEQWLCYWAWLKQDFYWHCFDVGCQEEAENAIDVMIQELLHQFPRDEGMGWDLTKVHEQRHVPFDIMRFGRHRNVHSGLCEHSHIVSVKRPATNTQKRSALLDKQLGERVAERHLIHRTMQIAQHAKKTDHHEVVPAEGWSVDMATKGQFEICNCGTQYTVSHKWNHRRNEHLKWKHHDEIAKALWTVFGRHLKDGESCVISSYTEVKIGSDVYRCHPDYKREGAWNDWVICEHNDRLVYCKLACLVSSDEGQILGLFFTSKSATVQNNSVLTQTFSLRVDSEDLFVCVPMRLSKVKKLIFVFANQCQNNEFIALRNRDYWHTKFI